MDLQDFVPVPCWDRYLINKNGDCYSLYSKKLLTRNLNKDGYERYGFSIKGQRKTFFVHQLVLLTF